MSVTYSTDASGVKTATFTGTGELSGATAQLDGATVAIIEGYSSIGEWAFSGATSLTSITIPAGVTSIRYAAFYNATSLTSITFAEGSQLTSIGDNAFRSASSLTSITIPEGVTSIESYAFYNASSLTSVTFAEGSQLAGIGEYTFWNASSLTSITIPASVEGIGQYAFYKASSLTSIIIPSGVTSIGDYAFAYTAKLQSITVDPDNANYSSLDGVLFNKNKTILLKYPTGNSAVSYTVPSSVETIEGRSFSILEYTDNNTLRTIILNNGLKNINIFAFRYSVVQSINIPDSVTSIGESAFSGATSLTSITIPAGVTSIGNYAFYGASSLTSITVTAGNTNYKDISGILFDLSGATLIQYPIGSTRTTYDIQEGVTIIGNYAFASASSLTSITIPASVTSIGDYAFYNASSLTIVYITNGQLGITSPATNVSFFGATVNTYTLEVAAAVAAAAPICFPAGTPVTTDQELIAIDKLNPSKHTIRGKDIIAITQTRPLFKEIVSIEKDALSANVPSQTTEISNEHKVFYKGTMVKARDLVEMCEGVKRIPYNGETLYNVLLKKHDKMMVNNLICETLDPKNIMAKICGGNYNDVEQRKICEVLNKIIKKDNVPAYKKLYALLT